MDVFGNNVYGVFNVGDLMDLCCEGIYLRLELYNGCGGTIYRLRLLKLLQKVPRKSLDQFLAGLQVK